MKVLLVLATVASAFAAEESSGGFLGSITNALEGVRAAGSYLVSSPETAPYEVTKNGTGYEVRVYPARTWVCTSRSWTDETPDLDDRSSRSGLFMRLYRYITGSNVGDMSMPMTTPVTMQWLPAASEIGGTYTMCFYVNEEYQQTTPVPSEEGVFLEQRPEITVIATREGGYPGEAEWEAMAKRLKEAAILGGDTDYDFTKYYRVGYDAPMKFWNRRNEVWYVKA